MQARHRRALNINSSAAMSVKRARSVDSDDDDPIVARKRQRTDDAQAAPAERVAADDPLPTRFKLARYCSRYDDTSTNTEHWSPEHRLTTVAEELSRLSRVGETDTIALLASTLREFVADVESLTARAQCTDHDPVLTDAVVAELQSVLPTVRAMCDPGTVLRKLAMHIEAVSSSIARARIDDVRLGEDPPAEAE